MQITWLLLLLVLDVIDWINCKSIGISNTMVVQLGSPEISLPLVAESSSNELGKWVPVIEGQTILLKCAEDGGQHHKMWITPSFRVFHSANKSYETLQKFQRMQQLQSNVQSHISVLHTGHLLINDFRRNDAGRYRCFTFINSNSTGIGHVINIGIDDAAFRRLYNYSLYIGMTTAGIFLLLVLLLQSLCYLVTRFGYKCCWGTYISPKTEKVGRLIKTIEQYKSQQLDRLNQNYNFQVSNIKETFSRQMEHLQESYTSKMQSFKDISQNSNHQLQQIRDQYNEQCSKVGEYSMRQMNKVHDNYMEQQDRVCRYSTQQLQHLKDSYKYQQKAFNKVFENIPDFNINSYLNMCGNNIEMKKASMSSSITIERDDKIILEKERYHKSLNNDKASSERINDNMLLAYLNASLTSHEKANNDMITNRNKKRQALKQKYMNEKNMPCKCMANNIYKSTDQLPNIHLPSLDTSQLTNLDILPGLTMEDKYNVGQRNGRTENSVVKPYNIISLGHLS